MPTAKKTKTAGPAKKKATKTAAKKQAARPAPALDWAATIKKAAAETNGLPFVAWISFPERRMVDSRRQFNWHSISFVPNCHLEAALRRTSLLGLRRYVPKCARSSVGRPYVRAQGQCLFRHIVRCDGAAERC